MKLVNAINLIRKIDEYYDDVAASSEKMPSGKFGMRIRAIWSFVVWGTSFSEYFGYKFFNKSWKEKKTYMTRRHMFKFFDRYNPAEYRERMGDKSQAAKYYGRFMNREQFVFEQGREAFIAFCDKYPRIFIKKAVGWGGEGAKIEDVSTAEKQETVWETLTAEFIVEPVIENCEELKKIHPASLNTVKIVTLQVKGKPEIPYAIFRIGNNTCVDNVHLGGMAAGVDTETGQVITPTVDRHFLKYDKHPITHEQILGITLPYWKEVRQMAIEAAMVTPQIRYTSWDIAITQNGPVLMEGNWDAEFYAEQEIFNQGNRTRFVELLERT